MAKGAQTVHYYAAYSNVWRGKKRKALQMQATSSAPATAPAHVQEPESPWIKERRKSWAALIKLIYEVDPLLCPKCRQPMSIIALIRDGAVIDKILNHLGYKFEVLPLPAPAIRPPPFLWSAEDFSQS